MPSRTPTRRGVPLDSVHRAAARAVIDVLEPRRLFAAGDPDPSFSGDGLATLTIGGSQLSAVDVAVQSTGKTIVVGGGGSGALVGKITVARFDAAGVLDTSFGSAGTGLVSVSYTDLNPNFSSVSTAAVAVQPADDKIVIVGKWSFYLVVTRLTADGLLDPTFSGDGREVSYALGDAPVQTYATDVAIQADGRIVVATTVADGFEFDFGLVRLLTTGNPDSSFSGDGAQIIGFGQDEFANALTIDSSGRIIVVGSSSAGASDYQFAVARLTAGGALDGSFSGDGKVLSRFTGSTLYSSARDVVAQPDGKLVIVGEIGSADSADHNTGLFRLNVNGTGDPSFGVGNGQTEIDFGGRDSVQSMIAGQTGQLIVGGGVPYASPPGMPSGVMTLACLSPNGLLDPVFGGGDGKQVFGFGSSFPYASASGMALAPNGTIVAAGGLNFATARVFDRKFATISIGTFQSEMYEQGQQGTSFIVGRLERLPTATRVFIATGGQATPPATLPPRPRDYNGTGITFGNGQFSSTYVDIPANATFAFVDITPVDDATVEGDELATFGIAPNAAYDTAPPPFTTLVIRDNDTLTPAVAASAFLFETAPQRLTFRFSQQVGASLAPADFQITGPAGIPSYTLVYDTVSNTASLNFNGRLADGNFSARVVGSGVTNAGGTPMAADHVFSFFFLNADGSRDRAVSLDDFTSLAANFGQIGRVFSQGNFNYSPDGAVNLDDFTLLAAQFGKTVPAPGDLPALSAADVPRTLARTPNSAAALWAIQSPFSPTRRVLSDVLEL